MDQGSPIVSLNGVSIWFPDPDTGEHRLVLEDIDLVVPAKETGEFLALVGPSGCGKSTILNLVSGMLTPDTGEVRVFDELVKGPHAMSATVWQAYTCFPWRTALGNVEFGLAIKGIARKTRQHIAREYLTKVGLGDWLNAYPHQLAGGMQQRVAIARALAVKPPIVLMDEPFGSLDAITREGMQQMLLELWEQERNSIIFVTHDIEEALLLADRIVVLSSGPARIVKDLQVPFPRACRRELVHDPEFIALTITLRQLLRRIQ